MKVIRTYSGPQVSDTAMAMKKCDPNGPLSIQVTKLYHASDAQSFRAFGRIMSGTLKRGARVKVLGEGFSPEDEEDMVKAVVDDIWISQAR
jgi:U5 small nuclear ribonucleoprotein component